MEKPEYTLRVEVNLYGSQSFGGGTLRVTKERTVASLDLRTLADLLMRVDQLFDQALSQWA